MAAKFHLAEDALALHLLLQHLEGLIDIVVTDENLHAAFLFDRAMMGPVAKAPGPLAYGNGTHGTNQRRELKLCLPMGAMAADWKSEDFGTPRQLFRQVSAWLYKCTNGRAVDKEQ